MRGVKSLTHSVWECGCHAVWMPKYRRKKLCGGLGECLGEIFRELARRKDIMSQRQGGAGRQSRNIQEQEAEGKRLDQLELFKDA